MTKYNAKNERIKKEYYDYLVESKGRSGKTLDQVRHSLLCFESYTKFKDFSSFNKEQAKGFKKHLIKQKAKRSGEAMSKSTLLHIVHNLKAFFFWLSEEKAFAGKIKRNDVEYFNLLENDRRAARGDVYKPFPTLEQVKAATLALPSQTGVEKRDRALMAFAILTGARDSAIVSLKIKHVDIHQRLLTQNPNDGVKTKRRKLIYTKFFPVGDEIENIVVEWIKYLREEKCYGDNDPLFPRTKLANNKDYCLEAQGLEPTHWRTTSQVRGIFKRAFDAAKLPYFNPHSFRSTLSNFGQKICSLEQFKAWSQNLGHERISTTINDYGKMTTHTQLQVMEKIELPLLRKDCQL